MPSFSEAELVTTDRVAQLKIRELNYSLTQARHYLRWVALKYAVSSGSLSGFDVDEALKEDLGLVHGRLMPRVMERRLMETAAREHVRRTFVEETELPMYDTGKAYERTPSVRDAVIADLLLRRIRLESIVEEFDPAQKTWEIATLAEQHGREIVGNTHSIFRATSAAGVQVRVFPPDLPTKGVDMLVGAGPDGFRRLSEDQLSNLWKNHADQICDAAIEDRKMKLSQSSLSKQSGPTLSRGGGGMSQAAYGKEEIGRLTRVFDGKSDFVWQGVQTRQNVAVDTRAAELIKQELQFVIQEANKRQTNAVLGMMLQMHRQTQQQLASQLARNRLTEEEFVSKERAAFAQIQKEMAGIGVKLDRIGKDIVVLDEKMDKLGEGMEKLYRKVGEVDEHVLELQDQVQDLTTQVSWLQKLQMRLGGTFFAVLVVIGIIALL